MKLLKTSQFSDKKINEILNYFILDYGADKEPKLYSFPFFVTSDVFRKQLNFQNKLKNIDEFRGDILHICYDVSGKYIYFPELQSQDDLKNENNQRLINRAYFDLEKIHKDFPSNISGNMIAGNPYNVFRIRNVDDFPSASSFIKKNISVGKIKYLNMTVIEADLNVMPKTAKSLGLDKNDISTFVGGKQAERNIIWDATKKDFISVTSDDIPISVIFVKTIDNKDFWLKTIVSPFILINIGSKFKLEETEKTRIVIEEYNSYIGEEGLGKKDDANIFRNKYLLSLGWSPTQLCQILITPETVRNVDDLLDKAGPAILVAGLELEQQGYKNPFKEYFYYLIKRTNNFPLKIPLKFGRGPLDTSGQHPVIQMLFYDMDNDIIVIRSRLYISQDICKNIFKSDDDVTILQYNPYNNVILPTGNIVKEKKTQKLYDVVGDDIRKLENLKTPPLLEHRGSSPKFLFDKRKISDYYQTADKLKNICKKLNIEFDDLDVYVGPLQRIIGENVLGGYGDKDRIKRETGKDYFMIGDWKIRPPFILIDAEEKVSVADRADTLMHEYRHHINKKVGVYSPKYEIPGESIEKMLIYLSSPDEIESHIVASMELLESGLSSDQIIRRFLKTETPSFSFKYIPVAKKYKEFIEEAKKRLGEQEIEDVEKEKTITTEKEDVAKVVKT